MRSDLLTRFSETVDHIYRGATEPGYWPVVVERVAAMHRCKKAHLFTMMQTPEAGGFSYPLGLDPVFMQEWAAKYASDDVWVNAAARKGLIKEGNVVLGTDLVSNKELKASRLSGAPEPRAARRLVLGDHLWTGQRRVAGHGDVGIRWAHRGSSTNRPSACTTWW